MQLKRIVFTGIASELSAECPGKTAGVAEACHICNLDHRILAALNQRQTLVDTIFFQIAGNCLAGHFFEQAAADLSGQMNLVFFVRQAVLTMLLSLSLKPMISSTSLLNVGMIRPIWMNKTRSAKSATDFIRQAILNKGRFLAVKKPLNLLL